MDDGSVLLLEKTAGSSGRGTVAGGQAVFSYDWDGTLSRESGLDQQLTLSRTAWPWPTNTLTRPTVQIQVVPFCVFPAGAPCLERTILQELFQVVGVASQVEDESGPSYLLGDVFVQELHVLIDAVDVGLLVQLHIHV